MVDDADKTSNGQNAFRLNARMEPEIDYEIDYSKANKRPQILAALAGTKSIEKVHQIIFYIQMN